MHISKAFIAGLSLVLAAAGCGYEFAVPTSSTITCATGSACPGGMICNTNLGRCVASEALDQTAPAFARTPTITPAVARHGIQVRAAFDVDGDLGSAPEAFLDMRGTLAPMTLVETASSGTHYEFTYTAKDTDPEGTIKALVTMVDKSGNKASGLVAGTITFDFTAPSLAAARIQPAVAKRGDEVTVVVTATEPLAGVPVLRAVRLGTGEALDFAHQEGTEYVYRHVVTGDEKGGAYAVSIELADAAGNRSPTLPAGGFSLDGTTPVLGEITLSPARASAQKGFDTVAVSFTSSEGLDDAPASLAATIGGRPMTCDAWSKTGTYTCTYTVRGFEGEGAQIVAIAAHDAAGNSASASATVVFDFTAPAVVDGTATLSLAPGDDNVLKEVSAVRPGTTITVSFSMTEALGADPVVATAAPGALAFARKAHAGTTWFYEHTLDDAAHAQGFRDVTVGAVDDVGNAGTTVLPLPEPGLRVDTVAPPAPDTVTQGRILYRRAPRGTAAAGGTARYTVRGATGAVAGLGTVIVYTAAAAPRSELGRAWSGYEGGFGEIEIYGDRASLFVAYADDAGNLSDAVEVKDVEWIATPAGKVAYSTIENPAAFETTTRFGPALAQDAAEAGDADGIGATGGKALSTAGLGGWRERSGTDAPSNLAPAIFDRVRGTAVLLAGPQDVWEWDSVTWSKAVVKDLEGDGNPAATGPWAFDERRGLGVLPEPVTGLVWSWDGQSWKKHVPIDPEGDGDPAYETNPEYGVVYDAGRDVIVMYRHETSQDCYDTPAPACDTVWEWNGTSWKGVIPDDPDGDGNPYDEEDAGYPGRLLYDRTVEAVVLVVANPLRGIRTWRWSGSDWTRLDATDAEGDGEPDADNLRALFYDEARERLVLLNASRDMYDTWTPCPDADMDRVVEECISRVVWEWDGRRWTRAAVVPAGFEQRPVSDSFTTAYDSLRGRLVAFDGTDTWEWDGAAWHRLGRTNPGTADNPRECRGAMTYDDARKRVVCWGTGDIPTYIEAGSSSGYNVCNSPLCTSTREWDGLNWNVITPADPEGDDNPCLRVGMKTVYDSARDRTVLFGGDWNPKDGVACPDGSPSGADSICYYGDTWEWNGASWKKISPSDPEGDGNPDPRRMHTMVYDTNRSRTVLFGGYWSANDGSNQKAVFGDTWEYDGTSWRKITPTDPEGDGNPMKGYGYAMVYDDIRKRVFMGGGGYYLYGGAATCDDGTVPVGSYCTSWSFWEWDGTSWEKVVATDPEGDGDPAPRRYVSLAYHTSRQRVVLNGGYDETRTCTGGKDTECRDVWEYDGTSWAKPKTLDEPGAETLYYDPLSGRLSTKWLNRDLDFAGDSRPGHLFRVPFVFAAKGTVTPVRVGVTWKAGANGFDGAKASNGSVLAVWQAGRWREVAIGTAGTASPADLSWFTMDPREIAGLFQGDDRTLSFAVRPAGKNGAAGATVATDFVEVTITYRKE